MNKNLKLRLRAEEKFEKRGLERTKLSRVRKTGPKSVGPQHPFKKLIHIYPATEKILQPYKYDASVYGFDAKCK